MSSPAAAEDGVGGGTPGSLREIWQGLRTRLLSSPSFQRWAAAFPLTRPIARRQARQLFDLCAGFVYSQVLLACVQLRVFDALAEGPLPLTVLARRCGLSDDAARRLLNAAASLKLLERNPGERYALGMLGAAASANPGIAAMVEHHVMAYADLRDPVALLRGELPRTALGDYWPYARTDAPRGIETGAARDYSRLMSLSVQMVADEVIAAYPLARHRCLLDVGGGEGGFIRAVAAAVPTIDLMLFDLPAVTVRARQAIDEAGISSRVTIVPGSFIDDPLPQGADIISLVRVVHDHDDEVVRGLFRSAYAALPAGGSLLIAEPMAGTRGAEPIGDAYFGFYLLAMGTGRARTTEELDRMLRDAGFVATQRVATRLPLITSILVARKA
jgi:demethylspheroidene O-methyltransferase